VAKHFVNFSNVKALKIVKYLLYPVLYHHVNVKNLNVIAHHHVIVHNHVNAKSLNAVTSHPMNVINRNVVHNHHVNANFLNVNYQS